MNNDNNKLLNSLVIILTVMLIFIGFTSYQSQVRFDEISSKIDNFNVRDVKVPDEEPINNEIPEEYKENKNLGVVNFDNVDNEQYLKDIAPIKINKDDVLTSIKEIEKVSGLITSNIKDAINAGTWEHGDVYKLFTEDSKSYTVRTHGGEVYGVVDDSTNKEKVIMEKKEIKELVNIQTKTVNSEKYGKYEYIEYAIRFETPDISENIVESVPHYVGYYIFTDADRNNREFISKLDNMLRENNIHEAYVYNSLELLEQDIANGDLDLDGYELAPNSVLHYTTNEVTK